MRIGRMMILQQPTFGRSEFRIVRFQDKKNTLYSYQRVSDDFRTDFIAQGPWIRMNNWWWKSDELLILYTQHTHCHRPSRSFIILWSYKMIKYSYHMLQLEGGTWYHHPRRLQCVLSRNMRIFKVARWHFRCHHHLKNNCIWDNLQFCLLFCS